MVKVKDDRPRTTTGEVDVEGWLAAFCAAAPARNPERLRQAVLKAQQAERDAIAAKNLWASGISSFETGLDMAEILAELRADEDAIIAGLLYRAVREKKLELQAVESAFGPRVRGLVDGVLRMAAVSALKLSSAPKAIGSQETQIENVRKMLVALIDDVRVALIKLAERTCAIRSAKLARRERQLRVAQEIVDVYAPLAHRLGIGHLRWELEDLAFRYLEPEAYKRVAKLLKERRKAREGYIKQVVATLTDKLESSGIHAVVSGRPKHIYSIYRKMQRKGIGFEEMYDVRAVRVLVDELRDCYGALGVVHSLWRHIPREFDDYITSPKENGYRSIHTAVVGPEGLTLEVQIRTQEMHEEAELGVCAHWAYKGDTLTDNSAYDRKVTWLRQVLEWQEELGDLGSLGDSLRREFDQERIYLLTPEGHVIDLAPRATPLDYAYRIHTEVGHRCRAARVDGRIVPLNTPLETGQKVEILTGDQEEPASSWLNPNLGYLTTPRARAKVQAWFRARDRARNLDEGRQRVLRELTRLSLDARVLPRVLPRLELDSEEVLFGAVAVGEVTMEAVLEAAQAVAEREGEDLQLDLLPQAAESLRPDVLGAGNRSVTLADCCTPEGHHSILGEVFEGAVRVHRRECPQILALERDAPGKLIKLEWGSSIPRRFPFDIEVRAYDRAGLLFDVTHVFAQEHVDVLSSTTRTDRLVSTATIELTVELDGLPSLGRLLDRITQIPNVIDARRTPRDGVGTALVRP
ncbi:MAG: bifunctional (p)ppGpp synthetase/guanosine-3',5'-bis(diphosphate) 3'-pyrophosphohydrolase [Pseudomonadales bacterium]|nr:bifunctional (p)ppGpp synthetase/guanosine-3',5'-bis(diphosphate) 3'-pyrophosphohydrolase [Pseudomonadales bacterium]